MSAILSVDELCTALEEILREHLHPTMTAFGFEYGEVKTWQQLPTIEALSSARLPGIAITSAGLVGQPTFSRASGLHTATWRLAVGVYDESRRGDHAETQARVRDWCAGIRATALAHKSLDGVAKSLVWAGEEYARIRGRESAQTIGAGAVALDVTADVTTTPTAGDLPTVLKTPTTVSVR